MDVIDANIEDVRFLQASRHGEVMTPIELVEGHAQDLGGRAAAVAERLRGGESLGLAMIRADVSEPARRLLLGHFVSDELADGLDTHYVLDNAEQYEEALRAELAVDEVLAATATVRRRAQRIGAAALAPFVALLARAQLGSPDSAVRGVVCRRSSPRCPGSPRIPKMRGLALREAMLEYAEYYFLFPLFLSITLLTSAGFFDSMQRLIVTGMATIGQANVALAQFFGATFLSAILDNNIVADFASRGLHGLDIDVLQAVRDGADRRLRARRLLDAHRLRAVGRRLRLHSARRRRALHAGPVDSRHHARHSHDARRAHRADLSGESPVLGIVIRTPGIEPLE